MPIKKIVLVFQVLILVMVGVSCKRQDKQKCLLFMEISKWEEPVEILNGNVKDVIIRDSPSKKINHSYDSVHFDEKGNMVLLHERYRNETWTHKLETVDIKVDYSNTFNKRGKRTSMTGKYSIHPDTPKADVATAKWNFDAIGHIIDYRSAYRFGGFFQYKFDTAGHIQYKKAWGKKDVPDVYKYKYDANNQITQIDRYEEGNTPFKIDNLRFTVIFRYLEFDSHNNWIKKTMHAFDTTYTITRKITYY